MNLPSRLSRIRSASFKTERCLEIDAPVTEEEYALADQYVLWFEENAMARLPVKRCDPIPLINCAKSYCKLIQLNAPAVVQEAKAKRFAEEFVLYHCMK